MNVERQRRMTVDEWRQSQRRQGQLARVAVQLLPMEYLPGNDEGIGQKLTLPFWLKSRSNFRGHTRNRTHRGAIRRQRGETRFFLEAKVRRPKLPCTITLVRIAPRKLDPDDNLPGAHKSVKDGVCDWLGVDDKVGCPVTWKYDQESAGMPHTYGCRIEIGT